MPNDDHIVDTTEPPTWEQPPPPRRRTAPKRKRRGHNEGSVFQRSSDGRWVAKVTLPGGGTKRVYAWTQEEAIVKRDALKLSISRGVLPDSMTLGEWCDYWLEVIAPVKLKPTTIDRHRSYVETWIKPTIGKVPLQDLRVDHVRLMMSKMQRHTSVRTHKPLSERTVIKARAVLQAALSQAENDGKVLYNVATRADPPKLRTEPALRKLSDDEAARVIDTSTDTRTRARLAVALMAGLRQGEALALRWECVTFAADGRSAVIDVRWSATRVRGQGMVVDTPKTLRSVRLVPLGPAAAHLLLAWREESGGRGYVFPGLRGPEVVEDSRRDNQVWRDALAAAGVPHVRLHDARGTAESRMASTVPPWVAAEIMGHSEDVARRYYNRATLEQRQLAAGAVDGFAYYNDDES